ncbi:MAG: hypothetical protein QXK63_05490 [Thermoproteus sp.]
MDSIRKAKSRILELNIEIQKYREKLEAYRKALNAINEYVGGRPLDKDKMKMLVEKLEYYFETTPTDPEWERQFIKAIAEIEEELNLADSLEKLRNHIQDIRNKLDELKKKKEEVRQEITQLVNTLNAIKEEMAKLKKEREEAYKQLVELKKKRDELKQNRDELKRAIVELAAKRKELRAQRAQLRDELEKYTILLKAADLSDRYRAAVEARNNAKENLRAKAEQIYQKLLRGERLTHEEMKILAEAGYLSEE